MMPIDDMVTNGNFTVFLLHHQYQLSSNIILNFTAKESPILKYGSLFVDSNDINISKMLLFITDAQDMLL
jgi:hypothetical protein